MHPYIDEALVAQHQRDLLDEAARERRARLLAPATPWRVRAGAALIRLGGSLAGQPTVRARPV